MVNRVAWHRAPHDDKCMGTAPLSCNNAYTMHRQHHTVNSGHLAVIKLHIVFLLLLRKLPTPTSSECTGARACSLVKATDCVQQCVRSTAAQGTIIQRTRRGAGTIISLKVLFERLARLAVFPPTGVIGTLRDSCGAEF